LVLAGLAHATRLDYVAARRKSNGEAATNPPDGIVSAFDRCIAAIENDKAPPAKLVSVKEFM